MTGKQATVLKTHHGDTEARSGEYWFLRGSASPWWILATAGMLLRVVQYAHNRSLWFDESLLGLNILHRSFGQLLQPLDYNQGAPLGFLFLQKLATVFFGSSEFALRAIPLAAGLASLLLFWRVSRLCATPKVATLAMALFALSGPLVYYSSEVKQYSFDVVVALSLLWAVLECRKSNFRTRNLLSLGLLGAAAIWFSHPASFVLAGVGMVLIVEAAGTRDWKRIQRLAAPMLAWVLSFAICYLVALRGLSRNHALLDYWQGYFFPWPLWTWHTVVWSFDRSFAIVGELTDVVPILGAALVVAGIGAMWRNRRDILFLLIAPVLVTGLATALHKYPFGGRLLLFCCPIFLLLMADGTMWCVEKLGRLLPAVAPVLIALVLAQPVATAASRLIHPKIIEDIRPAIAYIRSHQHPGDVWYVYHFARFQFQYYAERQGLSLENVRIGDDCASDKKCYLAELDQLRGTPRVWILFSHIWTGNGVNEEELFVNHLDGMGTRLDEFRVMQARAYLYDLK
jgi:dolichyl-phosphate-mannose-protein mannosyltransferase